MGSSESIYANDDNIRKLSKQKQCGKFHDEYTKCLNNIMHKKHIPVEICDKYVKAYGDCKKMENELSN
jgi:hypothetical protein